MSRILGAAFSRLSTRERLLLGGLGVGAVVGVFVLASVVFGGKIEKLSGDIAKERDSLNLVYAATDDYLAAQKRITSVRDQAEDNEKLTLTTAVAQLASGITFDATDNKNNPLGKKSLKDFLEFNALKEKQVGQRPKKSKSSKDTQQGYYQRDQDFTLKGTVPFDALYELFEKIEESSDMLFVTEMRLDKNPLDGDRTDNPKFTVSTFYYLPETAKAEATP